MDALEYVVLALNVILTGSEGMVSPSPVAVTVYALVSAIVNVASVLPIFITSMAIQFHRLWLE